MSKTLAQALADLPEDRQVEIEDRMLKIMNEGANSDGLYKQLRREGRIITTKRFIHDGDYYRQDDIDFEGSIYVVEMRNGELKRITK